MKNVQRTTKAGVVEYGVTVQQFESVAEARDAWKAKGLNPDEVLLGILNAAQEQNAKQGPKAAILSAIAEVKKTDPKADTATITGNAKVKEAVAAAQKTTAAYVIGAPRGASAGITKKDTDEGIKKLRSEGSDMSDEDMVREYIRLGLPIPSALKKLADKIRAEQGATA